MNGGIEVFVFHSYKHVAAASEIFDICKLPVLILFSFFPIFYKNNNEQKLKLYFC